MAIDVKQFKKDLKEIVRINSALCTVHLNCFQAGIQVTSRMVGTKCTFKEHELYVTGRAQLDDQGTTFRVPYGEIIDYTLHEVKGLQRAMCVNLKGRHAMVIREWV